MRSASRLLLSALLSCSGLATVIADDAGNEPEVPETGTRVTSTLNLNYPALGGIPFAELSGIAWDQDEQLLYAVSDAGHLYHLAVQIESDRLVAAKLVFATSLVDLNGARLTGDARDAEGLELLDADNGRRGDSRLLIVHERQPRLDVRDNEGRLLESIPLDDRLTDPAHYAHPNKSLESVVLHPRAGILVGTEKSLRDSDPGLHTLYDTRGRARLSFAVAPYDNSSLTGMTVAPSGDLVLIERAFTRITRPVYISLRRLDMATCLSGAPCEPEDLLVLSSQTHAYVDNYEGLAALGDNRYLMVSDDNRSPLQRTLLALVVVE